MKRVNECGHPEKRHVAHGKCSACYQWWAYRAKGKKAKRVYYDIKRKFGLDPEDYDRMLEEQNGLCAICGMVETRRTQGRLSVDHDPETGRVRGLLCHRCNTAIGLFLHDSALLRKASDYL